MLTKIRKNAKGFTLVEVIVVAVIVAVLALVAIQLYQGYVKESRKNTAENLAASAAGFLQTCVNTGTPIPTASTGTWDGPNGTKFVIPANATIILNTDTKSVSAAVGPTGNQDTSTGKYLYDVTAK